MSKIYTHISTEDPEYIKILNQYKSQLDNYYNYENSLSYKNKAKENDGKAASYKRYLIRSLIFYKRKYGDLPDNLNSSRFINQLQNILQDNKFQEINKRIHNFYSAAINGFIDFLVSTNDDLLERINSEKILEEYEKSHTKVRPIKKEKIQVVKLKKFLRNPMEKELAKKRANWKCEFDATHKTFNLPNGKQYVEAHHLIPMSAQSEFDNSIDFADNMVALCANCHRRIHLSTTKDKKEMIQHFYEQRKDKYLAHGIKINLDKLLSFYD